MSAALATSPLARTQPSLAATQSLPLSSSPQSTQSSVPPFFQNHQISLSQPASIKDYQPDPSAFPFRSPNIPTLPPVIPKSVPPPVLPVLSYTSDAEVQWSKDRLAAEEKARADAEYAERIKKDHSIPPPPFVSSLGFREAAPFPEMTPPVTEFNHKDGVSAQFFYGGTGRFISENGKSNSQMYYRLARPLAGRLKTHYASQTTSHGYRFDTYRNHP